ncbi:hypothetical protein EB796_014850 [Bugula neritina]|uniref:Uncharacterized protein n=1 Tax=Bugula neritina TaxID=10212 RepID=A0A7J7JN32_BUGNE|nr:hypothetical protein EB796_014850 [Bugula neritina]
MASTETTKYDSSEVKGDHEAEPSEGTPLLANKDEEPEELHGCGSYFCYDNASALQDDMMSDLNLSTESYMMFYSMYSYPNVILSFIGGYLIDKVFGVRLGAIIFAGFCLLGQVRRLSFCHENCFVQLILC